MCRVLSLRGDRSLREERVKIMETKVDNGVYGMARVLFGADIPEKIAEVFLLANQPTVDYQQLAEICRRLSEENYLEEMIEKIIFAVAVNKPDEAEIWFDALGKIFEDLPENWHFRINYFTALTLASFRLALHEERMQAVLNWLLKRLLVIEDKDLLPAYDLSPYFRGELSNLTKAYFRPGDESLRQAREKVAKRVLADICQSYIARRGLGNTQMISQFSYVLLEQICYIFKAIKMPIDSAIDLCLNTHLIGRYKDPNAKPDEAPKPEEASPAQKPSSPEEE